MGQEGAVMGALERVTAAGLVRTPDMGGSSTTSEVAQAVVEALQIGG